MSVVLAVPHKALLFISVPYSTSCFLAMYFGLPDCTTLCTIDKVWYATICMIDNVPFISRLSFLYLYQLVICLRICGLFAFC